MSMTSAVVCINDRSPAPTCPNMYAVSQIIERNLHRRAQCHSGLWINPQENESWKRAKINCDSLKLSSQDYGAYVFLQHTGADVEFAAFPHTSDAKYNWVILCLPRQKPLLRMLLDCAASLLADDGVLWLAGENKAGIKSAEKLLNLYFGNVKKLDNARHCTLYEAGNVLNQQAFKPSDYRQNWMLNTENKRISVTSYPGVFAHGRLDAGSALLLEALAEMTIEGDVLDFACGAGIIGACIAANHAQAKLTLLDNNALALRACEETLTNNHLQGAVLASDGLSTLDDSFDLVVSNPPIHAGIKTDNRLGMRLLDSVHKHIKPAGRLIIVANIHLPYERWLGQKFKRYRELRRNADYKVIAAESS